MRELRRVCLTLVVAAIVAAPILAQPPRPGGGRQGGTGLSLLTNKSVQEELKIKDEQKKKIEEATKKLDEIRQEKMKAAGITRENIREKTTELQKIGKELSEAADKSLGEVLEADQVKRFKQIRLQQQGIRAFTSEDVQKALSLTDDQQKKVKEITEDLTKKREELFKDAGRDFAKIREAFTKMNEQSKEAMGKVASSLSAEQKKKWKEMTGEPFEVKVEQRRPGGGGAGQPRRPGGDGQPRRPGNDNTQPRRPGNDL